LFSIEARMQQTT